MTCDRSFRNVLCSVVSMGASRPCLQGGSSRDQGILDRPVGTRPSLLEITVGPQVLLGVGIEPETTMLTYAVQPKPNSPEPSRFMLSQVLIS